MSAIGRHTTKEQYYPEIPTGICILCDIYRCLELSGELLPIPERGDDLRQVLESYSNETRYRYIFYCSQESYTLSRIMGVR